MKVGLQVNSFTWPGAPQETGTTLRRIARDAEAAGFYSLWVMDHFYQIPTLGQAEEPMLEGYTALSHVAAVTERLRLGTLVSGVTYRRPAVLVRTVSTLDVLSGGRAYFGVGAAWFEREHAGLGVPFPPLKERFERLEETLQIALQMWSEDNGPFEGAHYRLAETLNSPSSIQRPHPPIMIGGSGEQKTLRLVAQYGDACNLFDRLGPDALRQKLDVLHGHCERLGRRYGEIEKTTLGRMQVSADGSGDGVSVDEAVERIHRLAELGIDHAIFSTPNVYEPGALEIFGRVISSVEKLVPAGR